MCARVRLAHARRWHAHFARIAANVGAFGVDAFAIAWIANLLATTHAVAKVLGASTVDASFVWLAAFGTRGRTRAVVARCAGRTWIRIARVVDALANIVRIGNTQLTSGALAWQIEAIQAEAAAAFFAGAAGDVSTQVFALAIVWVTRKTVWTIHV